MFAKFWHNQTAATLQHHPHLKENSVPGTDEAPETWDEFLANTHQELATKLEAQLEEAYRLGLLHGRSQRNANMRVQLDSTRKSLDGAYQSIERLMQVINFLREQLATHGIPDTTLESLELSERPMGVLTRAGIVTIHDLVELTADDLLGFTNFGQQSLDEVTHKLGLRGFCLKGEELAEEYKHQLEDLPLDSLRLTERPRNRLKEAGIATLGELIDMSGAELLELRLVGGKSLAEIQAKLGEMGLALKGDPSPQSSKPVQEGELGASIHSLSLSTRVESALIRGGIRTVQDLTHKSGRELLEIKAVGAVALDEIVNRLEAFGLSLGQAAHPNS